MKQHATHFHSIAADWFPHVLALAYEQPGIMQNFTKW